MENKYKQFKPFDRVLVRLTNRWICDLYSHYNNDKSCHVVISGTGIKDENILPYEGNEGLLGTTHEPDEEIELKHGEWIVLFDEDEMGYPPFLVGQFTGLYKNKFNANDICEKELAIRFSDFNTNEMEETTKHILCVENGRIIRYNERV